MVYIPAIISVCALLAYSSIMFFNPYDRAVGLIHFSGLLWFFLAWIFLIIHFIFIFKERKKDEMSKHIFPCFIIFTCYGILILFLSDGVLHPI